MLQTKCQTGTATNTGADRAPDVPGPLPVPAARQVQPAPPVEQTPEQPAQVPTASTCPAWCTPDAHALDIDVIHHTPVSTVELSKYPYRVGNETVLAEYTGALVQEPGQAEPLVSLGDHTGTAEDRLTLAEAARVNAMIARLIGTGVQNRPAVIPQSCPAWCEETHDGPDDGAHTGPMLSVRNVQRQGPGIRPQPRADLLLSLFSQNGKQDTRIALATAEDPTEHLLTVAETVELIAALSELVAIATGTSE